jgi:hypothetical protein
MRGLSPELGSWLVLASILGPGGHGNLAFPGVASRPKKRAVVPATSE